MATLTNTKIKDTYDGLLKTTDNEALDVSGVTLIEDGLGNASALSVGRSGNGVSVSGLLDVSGEVQGTSLDINGAADISGNLAVDTNTLYVDAANNAVGIGISSGLTYPLTIQGATGVNNSYVHFVNATTGTAFSDGTQIGIPDGQSYFLINQREASDIRINTGGSEAMRIDSSGLVRIAGATNNSVTFDRTLEARGALISGITGTATAQLYLHRDDLTINSGDIIGELNFSAADGGSYVGAAIKGIAANNWGGSNSPTHLSFQTADTALSSPTERMRIDSAGNVGIGESVPLVPLHISKNTASGENIALILDNNNTTANSEVGLLFRSAVGSTNTDFQIATINKSANNADLVFRSDGANERMRIDSSGNVLINTTGNDDALLNLGDRSQSPVRRLQLGQEVNFFTVAANDPSLQVGESQRLTFSFTNSRTTSIIELDVIQDYTASNSAGNHQSAKVIFHVYMTSGSIATLNASTLVSGNGLDLTDFTFTDNSNGTFTIDIINNLGDPNVTQYVGVKITGATCNLISSTII